MGKNSLGYKGLGLSFNDIVVVGALGVGAYVFYKSGIFGLTQSVSNIGASANNLISGTLDDAGKFEKAGATALSDIWASIWGADTYTGTPIGSVINLGQPTITDNKTNSQEAIPTLQQINNAQLQTNTGTIFAPTEVPNVFVGTGKTSKGRTSTIIYTFNKGSYDYDLQNGTNFSGMNG